MSTANKNPDAAHVAVVIPCYKVADHIAAVIGGVPDWVRTIVCVDDASPDDSAQRILRLNDPRLVLLRHGRNQGVGGAMVTGYQECLRRDVDVIVKMDGDGQMDPAYLSTLIAPVLTGSADYVKGNRWYHASELTAMPRLRHLGSVGLSFLTKAASGYWGIFDPCNGYTAIRGSVLAQLPMQSLARDYYFETSILVELNICRAVVTDVPIPAKYGDERSSMRLSRIFWSFPIGLARSFVHRVWLRHFVRDFGPPALFLLWGLVLTGWGSAFGGWKWVQSLQSGLPATPGSVMLAALPFLMGFQLLLQFAVMEIRDQPKRALGHDQKSSVGPAPDPRFLKAA